MLTINLIQFAFLLLFVNASVTRIHIRMQLYISTYSNIYSIPACFYRLLANMRSPHAKTLHKNRATLGIHTYERKKMQRTRNKYKKIFKCRQKRKQRVIKANLHTQTYTIKPTSMKSSNQIKSNLKCKTNFHFHKMDGRYSCAKDILFFPRIVSTYWVWSVFGIRSSNSPIIIHISVVVLVYFIWCCVFFSVVACNSLTWSANHFSLHCDFPFVFSIRIWTEFFAWTTSHSRNMFGRTKKKKEERICFFFRFVHSFIYCSNFYPITIMFGSIIVGMNSQFFYLPGIFCFCIFFCTLFSFLHSVHSFPCISQHQSKKKYIWPFGIW